MSEGGSHTSKGVRSGRGVTVSTKGMISGPYTAPPAAAAPLPEGDPLVLSLTQVPVRIVVPTAINTCLLVTENIIDNMRVLQSASFTLPSAYKRAFLIAYETDEIAVVKP